MDCFIVLALVFLTIILSYSFIVLTGTENSLSVPKTNKSKIPIAAKNAKLCEELIFIQNIIVFKFYYHESKDYFNKHQPNILSLMVV
jgi:hypothetical protein